MSSFFESPEFLEQAAAGRVSHSPGMADELMQEMAPFLKAEGIDIDDPNADFTEAEFHAAMEKAQAQYNRRLFTPVGAHRGLALAELREFALAVAAGDVDGASAVVSSLPSDPEDFAPSVAQVTGAAMGLVDEWFTDETYGPRLGGVMAPKWRAKKSRAVARDILALAHKGRVVDSLDRLIAGNSGLPVLEGSMLAVAAAVTRLSRANKVPAEEVVDELMPLAGYPEPVAGSCAGTSAQTDGAVHDAETIQAELPAWLGGQTAEDQLLAGGGSAADAETDIDTRMDEVEAIVHEMPLNQRFRDWLSDELDDPGEDSEIFASAHLLFCIAVSAGISIEEPEGVLDLLDVLEGFAADGSKGESDRSTAIFVDSLEALDDYLHFRMDTDEDPARWDEVHTHAEAAGMRTDPLPAMLMNQIESSALDEEAAAPLPSNLLVDGVTGLLEWIGEGRAVTGKGRVKRADIAEVVAKFDINAVGVAANARVEDGVRYVRSIDEVPTFDEIWNVLQLAGIIELTGTKVRPGSAAEQWRAGDVPAETALPLVGSFIHELLGNAADMVGDSSPDTSRLLLAQRIAEILDAEAAPERPELELDEDLIQAMDEMAGKVIETLIGYGILERAADGSPNVPRHFHRIVAGAAVVLLTGWGHEEN